MKYCQIYKRVPIASGPQDSFVAEVYQTSRVGKDKLVKTFEGRTREELATLIDRHYGCSVYTQIQRLNTVELQTKMGEAFIRAPITLEDLLKISRMLQLEIAPKILK